VASEQKSSIGDRFWRTFRFLFGEDYIVIVWLIVLGGLSSIGNLFVTILLVFSLADSPPSSVANFVIVILGFLSELLESPGFWWLALGIAGFVLRRRCTLLDSQQAAPIASGRERGLFGVLFGDHYRVAVWIMLIGAVWAVRFGLYAAPSFLKWGKPPGYVWIGPPNRLPPVEDLVQEALIPMFSYVVTHSVGAWLVIAGTLIVLIQFGRALRQR
jgi:hypothetical protein